MPIIAISSDNFQQGLEIARSSAERLSYRFLGREILEEVAHEHRVSPKELLKALDEPPSFFSRRSQRKLITHIQVACLERLLEGKVVCYGLGAHLYLTGISHALLVRILSESQPDEARRRWSLEFFKVDETDPSLYDMVLSLDTLEPNKAVEIICDTAGYRKFQPMTYSSKCLMDRLLESKVYQRLMERFPDVRVQASDGTVVVQIQALKYDQRRKQKAVRDLACQVPGVEYVEVHVVSTFFDKAGSGR